MIDFDFTYFYKQKFSCLDEIRDSDYDILISTYNDSERVCRVFNGIYAKERYLIFLPENEINLFAELKDSYRVDVSYDGYEELTKFLDCLQLNEDTKLCIDITGFLIPHMLFIIRYLQKRKNLTHFDILYSEPQKYKLEENTNFSDFFNDVGQVYGYGGTPSPQMENDLLIIAAGYDDSRITDVANKKKGAKKIQLFGFPPLKADMFQENMLQAYKAEAAVGLEGFKNLELNIYAPANDPFVAAQSIKIFIDKEQRCRPYSNIYLAPVSTKPHALGMALYYLWENSKGDKPISIIYPNCDQYFGNTSVGLSNIWKYKIELPIIVLDE